MLSLPLSREQLSVSCYPTMKSSTYSYRLCAHLDSSFSFCDLSSSHYANTFLCPMSDFTYLLLPWCESFASALKPDLEDVEVSMKKWIVWYYLKHSCLYFPNLPPTCLHTAMLASSRRVLKSLTSVGRIDAALPKSSWVSEALFYRHNSKLSLQAWEANQEMTPKQNKAWGQRKI